MTTEKIVYIITRAGDEPELSVTPFALANAALAMDAEAVVILMGYAVLLAKKGYAETVFAPERPPMKKLMDDFVSYGGKLLVCSPCMGGRKIDPSDLVEGAEPVHASRVTQETLSAKCVISL
jgi:uncharacterized protein involved in oxidation of intracellular sulfur